MSRIAAVGDGDLQGQSSGEASANLIGATWMTVGMAGYVVNDALIKWATEDIPVFQAIANDEDLPGHQQCARQESGEAERREHFRHDGHIARTLGNCLSASSLSRIIQLMGAGRTKDLLFTSRLIEAEEIAQEARVHPVLRRTIQVVHPQTVVVEEGNESPRHANARVRRTHLGDHARRDRPARPLRLTT